MREKKMLWSSNWT